MMFYSGFLRKNLFRFSPGMTIILAGRHFLQEGYLPVPDRCQSAAFPSNHMFFAPPLPFFLLFLIYVTLLLLKKTSIFSCYPLQKPEGILPVRHLSISKNLQKQRIATPAGRQSSSVAAKKGKKIGRPPVFK